MKRKITILLILFGLTSNAQKPLIVEGQIIDEQNQAIPFATISSQNTYVATTTNLEGKFKLVLSESNEADSLIIRHISFKTKKSHFTKNTIKNFKTIQLEFKNNEIGATQVYGFNEITYIKKVIENLDKNYHSETYFLEGFYRQKHKENGKYVRLIEAISYIQENITNRASEKQKELFHIDKIRRSNVYERNGDKHSDHFVDLMSENLINYSQTSFLNLNNIHNYDFRKLESNNSSVVEIYFQNKTWKAPQNKSGIIVVNKEDFSVLSIEITSTKNANYVSPNISNWKFQNGTYQAKFIKGEEKYHCSESSKYYNHYVLNEQSSNIDFIVEEYFEWFTFDLSINKNTEKKYRPLSNLYSKDYNYNAEFWANIKLPKVDQTVFDDLDSFKDIEKQFIDD